LNFIDANLSHVLCGLLLISRIGDVATTYLITPNLILEANPIMRRLGWRFGLLTLGACFLPYFNVPISVAALVAFLLVSASNARSVWFVRTIGEKAYAELILATMRKGKLSHALASVAASTFFLALVGGTIMFFYPSPDGDWGFWIGFGVLIYASAVCLHGTLSTIRFFRLSAAGRQF